MEQLRQQNGQEKNSNRILGARDNLLHLQKRKELEKGIKKKKITLLKIQKTFYTKRRNK